MFSKSIKFSLDHPATFHNQLNSIKISLDHPATVLREILIDYVVAGSEWVGAWLRFEWV
jgi:hypothetical protein